MEKTLAGFTPIADLDAQILILGSMPGERSLLANEYYAHPQNAFWKIMNRLIHLNTTLPYAQRIEALKAARIAVWDVLQSCERSGSLDTAIQRESVVVNDFDSFFRQHEQLALVCFNGRVAEQLFSRHVLATLPPQHVQYARLPSTSPAHTLAFEKKVAAWAAVLTTARISK